MRGEAEAGAVQLIHARCDERDEAAAFRIEQEAERAVSTPALPLASDLGPGESGVLALALESQTMAPIHPSFRLHWRDQL